MADEMIYEAAPELLETAPELLDDGLAGGKRRRAPAKRAPAKRARTEASSFVVPVGTVDHLLAKTGLRRTHDSDKAVGADTALATVLTIIAKNLMKGAMKAKADRPAGAQIKAQDLQTALLDASFGTLATSQLRGANVVAAETKAKPVATKSTATKKKAKKA